MSQGPVYRSFGEAGCHSPPLAIFLPCDMWGPCKVTLMHEHEQLPATIPSHILALLPGFRCHGEPLAYPRSHDPLLSTPPDHHGSSPPFPIASPFSVLTPVTYPCLIMLTAAVALCRVAVH